jgi:hypothetical protein
MRWTVRFAGEGSENSITVEADTALDAAARLVEFTESPPPFSGKAIREILIRPMETDNTDEGLST